MTSAITIKNLSKQYRLGTIGTGTLTHDLKRWWANLRGKDDPSMKIGMENNLAEFAGEYVWALQDINFEIQKGEILGIIGNNGAGKSTLLKILSRVTSPTTGEIHMNGRVASLLEVGTGFHGELTGRENVFLNGTIMGMTKNEIKIRFDEIVDFAGVGKYIDTPVKRYSSGMYVRLAFAVAAHLEPEILIVDEVLAVGDAEFQKKAIGKMQDVGQKDGRTVLFVSHNMQAIQTLTNSSALLHNGKLISLGPSKAVIREYLQKTAISLSYFDNRNNLSIPFINKVECITSLPSNVQNINSPFYINIEVYTPVRIANAAISYQIINSSKQPVIHTLLLSSENKFCTDKGFYRLKSTISKLRLYPDTYSIKVYFADNKTKALYQVIDNICQFEVKILNEIRDFYWRDGNAIYLEEDFWSIEKIE
jgi:lipopolysaccharide transport system ATP-binding protein